ncbi:VWFA and cache domain-containing protein 1 [Bulinus truncatus]|nr:VWFA and cache domain-containing protein 1 [Bulinus truncatus]
MHTDIRHFEQHSGFLDIRSAILSQDQGDRTLILCSTNQTGVDGDEIIVEHSARYIWKKIESVPFIVVIKSYYERKEQKHLKNILMHNQPELLYHRLDLFPNEKMCYHLKQLSTPDLSTVFLSASSFINPFEHLSEEETKRSVQSYIAYLKDDTRLITNPGLKPQVRNDVAATGRITEEWQRRFKASNLNDYIIRRYVGTPSGVLRTFPGTLLDKMFDPTKREWYTTALEHPGQVTLSAPYLDVGGAGYIVTISHTIFEGKPAALHSPSDKVVAVMGMDITLGYFHKLLIAHIKLCDTKGVRCFLMDDKGYLIAHPGLIDPTGKGPAEQRHITHMEPLVANDILNHRGFVQKKLCNRYNDRTVQRYFNFNTSFVGTLTNLVHGEQCAKYQITHISGTNVFLGLVNHTCDTATAFCPCSMYDRLCLNCKRMEQTECECPCECPLEMDFCTGQLLDSDDKNPSCPHDPEREKLALSETVFKVDLEQCVKSSCDKRTNKLDCMGVMDCQWCQVQKDGKTPLENPFCGSQRVCFGGVVGAHSPYGDEISVEPDSPEQTGVKSTPVGPVAGGIMGCFLLLALGVYCYRHHVHRHSHHYMSTLPDNTNRISHYYNEEDQEGADDISAGECHTNFVLASFENPASVSPYRVNTSYRRPAGGDSDHGYSTMTPHEDSEHASMPCLDPLSLGKDRFRPGAHSLALCKPPVLPPPPQTGSRRSRSPTPSSDSPHYLSILSHPGADSYSV